MLDPKIDLFVSLFEDYAFPNDYFTDQNKNSRDYMQWFRSLGMIHKFDGQSFLMVQMSFFIIFIFHTHTHTYTHILTHIHTQN